MTTAAELASYASSFPSFRNRIINGNLSNPINQRGAGSITAPTGYTYDRWYYDGTNLYQGIEDKNVNDGTYVISWQGSGFNAYWKLSTDTTANNGPDSTSGFSSALSSGDTFTVSGSGTGNHLWIKFSLDTAADFSTLDKVMVEEGTVPTPFEHRPISVELSLCQRYYWRQTRGSSTYEDFILGGTVDQTTWARYPVRFPVEMRAKPSFSTTAAAGSYANLNSGGLRVATTVQEDTGSVNRMSAIIEVYSPNLSTNQATTFRANANSTATFEFKAEL